VRIFAGARRLFLSGALALCALSGALAAPIGSAIIVVNNVTGKVAQLAEGILLHVGTDVQQDETVETASVSSTRLIFQDNTKLEIGPTSQVTLDRLIYDPNPTNSAVALSVIKGAARFTTGVLPKTAYEIHTPVATLGVRGTILVIDVAPNGTTTVYDEEGVVNVTGGGVTVVLHAGQSTIVRVNSVPSNPLTGPNPRPFLSLPLLRQAALSPGVAAALLNLHPEGGVRLIDLVAGAIEENPGLAQLIVNAAQGATTAQQLALGTALSQARSYFASNGNTSGEQQIDMAMASAPPTMRTAGLPFNNDAPITSIVRATTNIGTPPCISPSKPGNRC
jgi:hypothetical protein